MRRSFLLLLAVVLVSCNARTNGHTGNGVFNNSVQASAAAMADADRVDAAQHLYQDGLYDRARVEVDRLLDEGVRHPQIFLLKAQLLRQAGDLDAAIPWCSKAVEASPLWIEPRILAAQIHLKQERYAAAGSLFEDIEHIDPKGPWGPYGLSVVAARRGDHAQAMLYADRALERDPEHVPSIELRAQLARLKGDAAGEERLLARLVALQPQDAGARARLGELAFAAGRLEDATRQFMRAFELEPRPATAAKLAELARLMGDGDAEQRWRGRSGQGAVAPPLQPGEAPPPGVH